jgi:ferredoxin
MATLITIDCINCGACEPECPNTAIYQGGVEWELGDTISPAISEDIFYIVPQKCTECVGFYEQEACAAVCPVDCCIPDPDIPETEDVLLARAKELHPEESFEGDFPSRFKGAEAEAPAAPAAPAEAPAPQTNGAAEPAAAPVAAPVAAPAAAAAPVAVAPKPAAAPAPAPVPKKEVREKLFPGELAESYEAALSRITPAQAHLGLGSVVAILQPLLGALPASTKNSLEEALDDPRYFSAASSTGMNVLLNMVLYPALCLAAYTTMGGELFSQQANASIFIGLLIASGETVVRLREALFQGAPSDEARFRGAPYGLALAPLAAPFLGTRSKRSQERGSIPIEGYYSGEFDEKTERSRRYGEAYSVEEENNAYLLRLEFPRRVPVSALKREMGIGDEMPDYEYELSLQEDQFLVKGNMTDPDIRKLAAVSPAFPPDFTKRIAFDRPIASFRHRYRDKTLEVILFQR